MKATREKSAYEQVAAIAERQIESIRVLLCPEESDVELSDDGTLDTVLTVDNEHEFRYSQEYASCYVAQCSAPDGCWCDTFARKENK
jgi:hypothetical protein